MPRTAARRRAQPKRRNFGRIEERDSGRYRAAYTGPDGKLYRAPSTFDAKDDATAWLAARRAEIQLKVWANLIRALVKRDPDVDLGNAIQACESLERRAHLVSASLSELDDLTEPIQHALGTLQSDLARQLLDPLLEDLRRGDTSTGFSGGPFLYSFVDDAGLMPELAAHVGQGIEQGAFTLEDVAARLVGFAYTVGSSTTQPSSASFSGDLLTKLTGHGADSTDLSERGAWPDTSWSRRREFSRAYVHRPAPHADGQPSHPGRRTADETE